MYVSFLLELFIYSYNSEDNIDVYEKRKIVQVEGFFYLMKSVQKKEKSKIFLQ